MNDVVLIIRSKIDSHFYNNIGHNNGAILSTLSQENTLHFKF